MAETMADSVHERVGSLEQEMHTVKYQLSELRALPPRVSNTENQVATMDVRLTHIESATKRIEEKTDGVISAVSELSTRSATNIRNISLLCTVLGALAIVVAWMS